MGNQSKRRKNNSKRKTKSAIVIILILVVIAAVAVMLFKHFDQSKHTAKKDDKEKAKKEKVVLSEKEKASYFAGLLEDRDFNLIAEHPIDIDKAFTEYLSKESKEDCNELIKVKTTGKCDQNTPGQYELKIKIMDKAGDKKTVKKTIGVIDLNDDDTGDFSFLTETGFIGSRNDGITTIDGVVIANKTFTVPEDYGYDITDDAMHAFDRMQTAALNDDIDIFIKSDYRSYFDQKVVYEGYVKEHGKKEADRYSARPGHSEHQLGECVDINYTDKSFADTPEGQWVDKNCSKYGYIIRYPEGKMNESMYIYEPWHLRYVGKKLAKKLYNNGDWITLEEYFGIDSKYTDDDEAKDEEKDTNQDESYDENSDDYNTDDDSYDEQ
jgi:hypothetical protein